MAHFSYGCMKRKYEYEKEKINFLDIQVKLNDADITTKIYVKPTD